MPRAHPQGTDVRECPYCGAGAGGSAPVLADDESNRIEDETECWVICIYCSGVAVWSNGELRKLTPDEAREVINDPMLTGAIAAADLWRATHPHRE